MDRIKLIYNPSVDTLINEQKWLYSKCGLYENYSRKNQCGFDVNYLKEIEQQTTSRNEALNWNQQINDQMHLN